MRDYFQTGLNQEDTIKYMLQGGIEALRRRPLERGNYVMIIKDPLMNFGYPILSYGVEGLMMPRRREGDTPIWG